MSQPERITLGNYCLQNDTFTVRTTTNRDLFNSEINSLPIARGDGSQVISTKLAQREITIEGSILADNVLDLADKRIELEKALTVDETILRFIPSYTTVKKPVSTSGWNVQYDATNLTYDSTQGQTGNGVLKFDADVSLDTSHRVSINGSVANLDLTMANGTVECFFYVPDARYVREVEVILQNTADTLHYFRQSSNITSDRFVNGWNLLVSDINNPYLVASGAGVYDMSNIKRVYFRIWYSAEQEDMTGIMFDGVYVVDDNYTRNYNVFRQSGSIEGQHYNIEYANFSATFVAPDGYSYSTNVRSEGNNTGIVGTYDMATIEPIGTYPALIENSLVINTSTNISSITLTNKSNNTAITINDSTAAIADGDSISISSLNSQVSKNGSPIDFDGNIPTAILGKNYLELTLNSSLGTTVPSSPISDNKDRGYTIPSGKLFGEVRFAQTFTATATGSVTQLKLNVRRQTNWVPTLKEGFYWMITNTSAGVPSTTVLASGYVPYITTSNYEYVINGISASVTNGSVYAIVVSAGYRNGTITEQDVYRSNSSGVYAGGTLYYTLDNTSGWYVNDGTYAVLAAAEDLDFSLTISPTPAWNVDWYVTYINRYLS